MCCRSGSKCEGPVKIALRRPAPNAIRASGGASMPETNCRASLAATKPPALPAAAALPEP